MKETVHNTIKGINNIYLFLFIFMLTCKNTIITFISQAHYFMDVECAHKKILIYLAFVH